MNLKNINISNINTIKTEEATKTALIMPFLVELGYNVFNPEEVIPEFVADIAKRNGEKVDYAIKINGKVSIVIEAKDIKENLSNHSKQLARYFVNTEAKIAILTNGLEYWFFTDLEKDNIMDNDPFFKINLTDYTKEQEEQLKDFTKEHFDENRLYGNAEKLRIQKKLATEIVNQFRDPSDEFTRVIINDIYSGTKTQAVLTEYREYIKAAYENVMNAEMMKRIFPNQDVELEVEDKVVTEVKKKEANTTENELAVYNYIQVMLQAECKQKGIKLTWKDNLSYFNILLNGKVSKCIVRVFDKKELKATIYTPEDELVIELNTPLDILEYKEQVKQAFEFKL